MSLKARIEAVIYAAEEPVTLAQLATLFRDEALASRAARLAPAEPVADPDAPAQSGLPAELAVAPDRDETSAGPEESEEQSAERPVPSEPGAQNSSDAEVATPDFAGEPQPFPNEPAEATTPGRENDAGLTPDEQRPEHADAPATNAEPGEAQPEVDDQNGVVPEASEGQPGDRAGLEADPAGAEREAEAAQRAAARLRDREAREEIRRLLDELIGEYASSGRGVEIREIAGGFRMATRPEYHDAVRAFVKSLKPPMKLSLQALETLAVIAYKQPVTGPEIGEIRGVDSGGVLGSLVARKLITTAGRKQVIGRPILYKTTKEFLLRFGLRDLNELPSLEEFEKMATELAESEETTEELPFNRKETADEDGAEETEPPANSEPSAESSDAQSGQESGAASASEPEPAGDPSPSEPPVTEPQPEEPPPPVEEPEPEPEEAAPTSEHDAAGPGSGDPAPPPLEGD